MIELFQYPPAFKLPSPSPFCVKMELLLLMAQVPYTNRYGADVRKAPKAKLPYVVIDSTQVLADSDLILQHLKETGAFNEDAWLSAEQWAQGVAVTRLVEDHLYWLLVDSRWLNDAVWPALKEQFFAALPPVVRTIVPALVRRSVRRTLHGQGLGRHTPEERAYFAGQDLKALHTLLGDKPYLMGERICSFDATVYGMLSSILHPDFATPPKALLLGHPNLVAYCDRITARFFPDYRR